MGRLHSIDSERRLYVLNACPGFTCLGFDYAERRTAGVLAWLRREGADLPEFSHPAAPGSAERFAQYEETMEAGRTFNRISGKRCPSEMEPQLQGLEGKRVEVVDRHGERRRFYVGKSSGWMPCHLEVSRRNSSGGPAAMGAPFKSVVAVGAR